MIVLLCISCAKAGVKVVQSAKAWRIEVKGIANGTRSYGFDFWTRQMVRSVANGLPPLRCFFKAALPEA